MNSWNPPSAGDADAMAWLSYLEDILRGPGFPLFLGMGQSADQKDCLFWHIVKLTLDQSGDRGVEG